MEFVKDAKNHIKKINKNMEDENIIGGCFCTKSFGKLWPLKNLARMFRKEKF